jgi:hypothetical protein
MIPEMQTQVLLQLSTPAQCEWPCTLLWIHTRFEQSCSDMFRRSASAAPQDVCHKLQARMVLPKPSSNDRSIGRFFSSYAELFPKKQRFGSAGKPEAVLAGRAFWHLS